jgi:hypothetical protein
MDYRPSQPQEPKGEAVSGNLMLVLLLATGVGPAGVAQADKKPGAEQAATASEAKVKTKAVEAEKKEAQAKTKAAREGTAEAPAETKKSQGRTEAAQVKTEAVKGEKTEAPAKTKAAQEGTAEALAETKKAQGQTEAAQEKTETAQGQTDESQPQADQDPKLTSVPGGKALGMSILGNQEAPTSLVIVPWKSSEVGRSPGISPMLDDSRQPVDKEVFMRELRYYEIRSEKKP